MVRLIPKPISPEEYLELERVAEVRHEFVDGVMYAVAGASRAHNLVAGVSVLYRSRTVFLGRPIRHFRMVISDLSKCICVSWTPLDSTSSQPPQIKIRAKSGSICE